MQPIRILLIHDQAIVRAGLRTLIDSWPGCRIIAEAPRGAEAIAITVKEAPDIAILDLNLGGDESSLAFLTDLLSVIGSGHVIILTDEQDPDSRLQAVRLGAKGIVAKNKAVEELRKSIHKVHAGELWLDRALTASIIKEMWRPREPLPLDSEEARIASLSPREREVAMLVCQGLKNKDIADRLFISETTVRHHLTAIFGKIGVAGRFELVILLYKHKFAKPPT